MDKKYYTPWQNLNTIFQISNFINEISDENLSMINSFICTNNKTLQHFIFTRVFSYYSNQYLSWLCIYPNKGCVLLGFWGKAIQEN
jgi:hypothetical protein